MINEHEFFAEPVNNPSYFPENLEKMAMVFPNQLIYVSNNGSDTTGDGSINNPYKTINYAMGVITTATPTTPFYIIAVGVFTEVSVSLKPNVSIVGLSTSCKLNGNIVQDASWSSAPTGSKSILYNLVVNNLTFQPNSPSSAFLDLYNVTVNQVMTTGSLNNKQLNVTIYNSNFNGAVNFNNQFCYSVGSGYLKPVAIGFGSTFTNVVFNSRADTYFNNASISITTQSNIAQVRLNGCAVFSSISASNNAQVFLDPTSYVQPILSGSATLTLTAPSNAVNANYTPTDYTPTNPSVQGHLQGINNALGTLSPPVTNITNTANVNLIAGQNYISTYSGIVNFLLPVTAAAGQTMLIGCYGPSAFFTITQNSGQTIYDGISSTSTGVSGALSTTLSDPYSSLSLLCVHANTDFMVINSQGNFVAV